MLAAEEIVKPIESIEPEEIVASIEPASFRVETLEILRIMFDKIRPNGLWLPQQKYHVTYREKVITVVLKFIVLKRLSKKDTHKYRCEVINNEPYNSGGQAQVSHILVTLQPYHNILTKSVKSIEKINTLRQLKNYRLSQTEEDNHKLFDLVCNEVRLAPPYLSLKNPIRTPYGIFLVQRFIPGRPLSEVLRLPLSEYNELQRLYTAYHIMVAHEQFTYKPGVIHRDYKPENIIMDGANQPKIIDYGCAKKASRQLVCEKFGTDEYASPEALVELHTTSASDIHLLGVTFAELFLYEWLLDGEKKPLEEILLKMINPHALDNLFFNMPGMRPEVAQFLRGFLSTMCAFNPAARPDIDTIKAAFVLAIKLQENYVIPTQQLLPPSLLISPLSELLRITASEFNLLNSKLAGVSSCGIIQSQPAMNIPQGEEPEKKQNSKKGIWGLFHWSKKSGSNIEKDNNKVSRFMQ